MKTPEKIETEAALWAVRMERGLTAAEQDDFLQWLTADPRHGRELERQTANWTRLDVLADWRPEHGARPNRDLLAPPPPRAKSLKPGRPWYWSPEVALAAAAAVVFGFFLLRPAPEAAPEPVKAVAPAQIAAIERRTLDDGSVIELNRGAEVSVLYTATERKVRLEHGEAMFRVAKNPGRPFIVIAGDVHFRAVGTAFNVRRETESVELIVTEGKVRVQPIVAAQPNGAGTVDEVAEPLVEAGEMALVPAKAAGAEILVTKIPAAQREEKLVWHSRLLDFTNARLSVVVEEFNRRNAPIRIVLDHASLADTEVSASLRSDNIESFIRLLEGGFGVEAERSGNVVTLRKRR
jgi:transmembrane sensor